MKPEFPVAPAAELLVIGYGNSLRGDDGIGPRVAEAIAAAQLPGVQTLVSQQLSPEQADPVSRARRVIFVDAAVDDLSGVKCRQLEPGSTTQLMAHAADPRTLLALARDVFGRAPEAWWLTIPALNLEFGADFSPATEAGFHAAVRLIHRFATENCSATRKISEVQANCGEAPTAPAR